jgi:hypothetical protein
LEGTALAPRSLKASRKRRRGADFGLLPDMEHAGSAELAPSSAWPRPSRAFSLVKTRRLPCA